MGSAPPTQGGRAALSANHSATPPLLPPQKAKRMEILRAADGEHLMMIRNPLVLRYTLLHWWCAPSKLHRLWNA